MHNRLLFLSISLSFFACNRSSDQSVTLTKIDSDKVYTIHLNEIKDSLTLHLADMVEDFEFIPLETNEDCMINWGECYITNEYILFKQRQSGILQFDRSGKFIRTLLKQGRGPREYSDAGWTVDEQKQILYITDIQKDRYFLRFDLHSGAYLGDLPKAGICRNYAIYINPDQSLMVIPAGSLLDDSLPSYVYRQDLEGHLIDAIETDDTTHIYGVYPSFYPIGKDYRYHISGDDTLFTIRDLRMIPFMIIDYGQKNPPYIVDIGHHSIAINFETDRWLSLADHIITQNPGGTNPQGPMAYYTLDKKVLKLHHQGTVFIDPTHQGLSFRSIESLTLQPNGIFNFVYQAINLLEQADKALADPEFKEPNRSKLKEVVAKITEEDNPVLLIGKIKK